MREAEGAPAKAPVTTRAMNCGGTVRLGVLGRLSLMISPMARRVRMMAVMMELRKARWVPARLIQPRSAPQLTTVGAVKARSPAMTPMRRARTRMVMGVLLEVSSLSCKGYVGR